MAATVYGRSQAVDWINVVTQYGADPSGVADSAPAIQNAISALPATGGVVYLPAGTYKVSSTLTCTSLYAHIRGDGRWATKISFTGTGDCLRVYNTSTTGLLTGGGVRDLTIDGTSAGAGSTGLHYGDMRAGELRLAVQNFSGSGSIGIHFDNQNAWTEECHGYLWLSNNTQNIVFDVSGANTSTNSFGYSDFTTEILAKVGQDGVVLQNGALLYNSRFSLKANFQGNSSAQANAVLRITGTVPAGHPNAGGGSAVHSCRLDVLAECSSALGSNAPQTIAFGTLSTNTLLGCTGILDFAQGSLAFATTNYTATGAAGTFSFDGVIRGDFNLNNATVGLSSTYSFGTAGVRTYGKSLLSVANGNVQADQGDFFSSTLTGSITINLNPGGAATLATAQRKTIIIKQAASGGPYTVTWPSTGSPTTTNCTVIWPGGTAPVMSRAANAVDVYFLDTYDGATWYGRAAQASPPPVSGQFLCTPVSYAPGSLTALTATTTTMAALSSANVNTGSFTAPASGSVVVGVSLVANVSTGGNALAFALAAHGTVSPLSGNDVVFGDSATQVFRAYSWQFIVTGLTAGTSYNFDLLACTTSGTLTVNALGTSSTTPTLTTRAAPVTMTVQAV